MQKTSYCRMTGIKHFFHAGLLLCLGFLLPGCSGGKSTAHIPAVKDFDPHAYMGLWYEIARVPNSFEKDLTHVTAEYSLGKDGKIKVLNTGMKNGKIKQTEGVAKLTENTSTGELKVSFFKPFYAPYRIILLEADYSAAVICGDTDAYLWILSRTPEISGEKLQKYLDWMKQQGLPVEQLEYPDQSGRKPHDPGN